MSGRVSRRVRSQPAIAPHEFTCSDLNKPAAVVSTDVVSVLAYIVVEITLKLDSYSISSLLILSAADLEIIKQDTEIAVRRTQCSIHARNGRHWKKAENLNICLA